MCQSADEAQEQFECGDDKSNVDIFFTQENREINSFDYVFIVVFCKSFIKQIFS